MTSSTHLYEYATGSPADPAVLRGHETRARQITLFAPTVLPDLLFTPDYARSLWQRDPTISDETIPERLAVLDKRQQAVFREGGPVVRVFVTVAALMSEAVEAATTHQQRIHQVSLIQQHRDSLNVRVIADGYTPTERFAMYESPDRDPVVYLPGTATELFLTAPSHVVAYWALLDSFDRAGWPPHESRTFLAELTVRNIADVKTQKQAAALAESFGFTEGD